MKITSIAVLLALCGCVGMPRHESRPTSFSDNPATPFEQARAVCGPRAQLAAGQARSQADAELKAGQIGGVTAGMAPTRAGDAVYAGCLAEYGWRVDKVCVQNCR